MGIQNSKLWISKNYFWYWKISMIFKIQIMDTHKWIMDTRKWIFNIEISWPIFDIQNNVHMDLHHTALLWIDRYANMGGTRYVPLSDIWNSCTTAFEMRFVVLGEWKNYYYITEMVGICSCTVLSQTWFV